MKVIKQKRTKLDLIQHSSSYLIPFLVIGVKFAASVF